MVHNEMSFLFGTTPIIGKAPEQMKNIVNNNAGNKGDIYGVVDTTKYDRIYKDKNLSYRNNPIDYINETIYDDNRIGKDPYIALIDYFNGEGKDNKHGPVSMTLTAADFAYLTDIGVHPINKLVILRRYRDGVVVPNNLSLFKERPISTVIGWVKSDEATKELFSINFGERWTDSTETLDKLLMRIMKEQFPFLNPGALFPIPAWSQGFLFGFLKKMGLTNFDGNNVPTGDPNVLRQSKMRDVEGQSLDSSMQITLTTSYEQKYIDGVDPSLAFQDIIANLVRCGTSDMKFILDSSNDAFQKLFGAVLMGGDKDRVNAWVSVGQSLITAFMDAVDSVFSDATSAYNQMSTLTQQNIDEAVKVNEAQKKKNEADLKADNDELARLTKEKLKYDEKNDSKYDKRGVIDQRMRELQAKIANRNKSENQIAQTVTQGITDVITGAKAGFTSISGILNDFGNTILAGSVYRYRWPLIGSIGLMSGLSTTPWHLTIGNPFSPILCLSNIYASKVDLKFSNELGFNDMPKRVDVSITMDLARPLGRQEINRMFNNQYGRIYSKVSNTGTTTTQNTSGEVISQEINRNNPTSTPTSNIVAANSLNNNSKNISYG
jgi:hypothetical protein